MKIAFYCILLLSVFSCDIKCKCVSEEKQVKFNVFDQQTSSNLFFGSSAIYDYQELKIFRLNGTDTVFYPTELSVEGSDTFLLLKTNLDETNLSFKFPDTTMATLAITYDKTPENAKCCANMTHYSAFSFNGTTVDMPAEENDYSLRLFK